MSEVDQQEKTEQIQQTEPTTSESNANNGDTGYISVPNEGETESKRLFVRPINHDTSLEEVENLFIKIGPISDVSLKPGYGFIEYTHLEDAQKAIDELNKDSSLGYEIMVERAMARGTPKTRLSGTDGREPRPPKPEATHRLLISGVNDHFSWQDLKDLSRDNGVEAVFTKVDHDNTGVIDVASSSDRDSLLNITGSEWKNASLEIREDPRGPPPPPPAGARRGGRGGRGDRFGGRGGRGDRFGGRGGRGDRRGGRGDRFGGRGGGDRYGDRYGDRNDRFDRRDRGGRGDRRGGFNRERSRSPPRRQEEPSW